MSFIILPDSVDAVVDAFRKSNISTFASYFDNTIEISMPDKSDTYNKAQAEIVIKDFFNNNTFKKFIVEQKGNTNGSSYCIGTLQVSKTQYRVSMYLRNKDKKSVLQEIRIENKR